MTEQRANDPRQAVQISATIFVVALLLNALVYFVAEDYYRTRLGPAPVPEELLANTRAVFAQFSGITALAAMAAVWSPRIVGHALAGLALLGSLAGGIAAYDAGYHPVLPASLIVIAFVLEELIRHSLEGSRAAWAFLVSTLGVLATVTLFGSTKIRSALDIGLWQAMIIPGVLSAATTALALARDDYRAPAPAPARAR